MLRPSPHPPRRPPAPSPPTLPSGSFPRSPSLLLLLVAFLATFTSPTTAQLIHVSQPRSCLGTGSLVAPLSRQLQITDLYAQLDQGQQSVGAKAGGISFDALPAPLFTQEGDVLTGRGDVLRVVLVGNVEDESEGYSNDTSYLSTLVVSSEVLTFEVAANSSWLCSSIRTNEGTTGTTTNGSAVVTDSGCPYQGEVAVGLTIPLASSYPLTTITTSVVALDPSVPALHLACYDLDFTPYYPDYFAYPLIRYVVIGLLGFYLLLYVLARAYASYTTWLSDNEAELASSLTLKISSPAHADVSRREMYGAVWFGAWAGKQVVASGSLRRYVTAEVRELFQTVAWFSLVGTVAVKWPGFAYPVFAQTAWTALIYNNTLSFTSPAEPVLPENGTAPSLFAAQASDTTSPLYLDTSLPNVLLDLDSSTDGIERWARMVGVRPKDLWSICAFTFFAICAGVIGAHLVFFAFDSLLDAVLPNRRGGAIKQVNVDGADGAERKPPLEGEEDPSGYALGKKQSGRPSDGSMGRYMGSGDFLDSDYLDSAAGGGEYGRPPPREEKFPSWKLHLALLQGNLVRVLLLFHLPLCLFSAYQFTLYSTSPTSTFALAVVSFALACLAAPAYLLWKVHVKPVRELYGHLPTLLAFGPMFNTYSEECTLFPLVTFASNLVVGVIIGAVQGTGTAQAAVILIVEVAHTLITSLWLPWGDNSAMGPLAFLLSLARIVIAVLLVVLSPSVNVSAQAASWIAYIVFLAQGLVILLLLFVLAFKFFELVVRVIGGVPFDESRSPRGGGLFGALRKLDRRGGGGKKRRGGPRSGAARSNAAKRRAIEERRRRNLHRERYGGTGGSERSSAPSRTHMLPSAARPAGHSSLSLNGLNAPFPNDGLGDDGYIMSAMSSRGWDTASEASSQRPGYVKPGAYASAPILRNVQQHWGHSQVSMGSSPAPASAIIVPAAVQATTPSAGSTGSGSFTRVGGGRASHSNPYQLVGGSAPGASPTVYPPYPSSSADMYGTPSSALVMPPNQRRQSQTAIVELANASSPNLIGGVPTRPSLSLPSSSALLSNSVSPAGGRGRLDDEHNRRPSARVRNRQAANQGGFFGRFKKQRAEYSDEDDFTDETETDEDTETVRPRRGGGGGGGGGWGALAGLGGAFRGGGKKKARRSGGAGYSSAEEDVPPEPPVEETGEKGFSVVRKPRPRPSPQLAAGASEPKATDFGASPAPGTPTTPVHAARDPLLGQSTSSAGSASSAPLPPPVPAVVSDSSRSTPPPPHVSIEAPSRPGSLKGEEIGEAWEEREER
ncbi:hypothetical protein JCM6882_006725 [Rhodosporidiobolus microsporus]